MTSLRTVACCAVSEPTPARGRVDRLSDLPHLPPMPKTMLLLAVLLSAGAPGLTAQTEYYARVGAVGASNLLRDVILSEITVRQSIAPMLALGGSLPIGPRGYRAGLEGTFASGKYHSSQGTARTDLGTLRTGTLLLNGSAVTLGASVSATDISGGKLTFSPAANAEYRVPAQAVPPYSQGMPWMSA